MNQKTTNLGTPITSYEVNQCIGCDKWDSHHNLYVPVRGKMFYAYDLDTRQKIGQAYTGINSPRGCVVASDHRVYVCGDQTLFRYDPAQNKGEILDFTPELDEDGLKGVVWCMDVDQEDNLYMGASRDGSVYKYNTKTGAVTHSPRLVEGVAIISGVRCHKGFVYASGHSGTESGVLYKLDSETLRPVDSLVMETPNGIVENIPYISIVDNVLIGGFGGLKLTVAVDLDTFTLIQIQDAVPCKLFVTQGRGEKSYFAAICGGLYEYDSKARKMAPVAGFEDVSVGFRSAKHALVTLDDPQLPGDSLVTCDEHDGTPIFYNLQTGKTVRWDGFVAEEDGGGSYLRGFASGPKGSGDIYLGAFQTDHCSVFNTGVQKVTSRYCTGAHQTDSQLWYRGKIYAGVYATGCLVEVDPETNERRVLVELKKQFRQARIHTLSAGDGKIFAGSTPDSGQYGGCIAWYDLETGESYVERNVLQDQTNHCVVYQNGYLYGTGSTSGGNKTGFNGDDAKIFVYDVENRRKVGEYTVDIPGIEKPLFIAGIAPDPKEAGKFWGIVSETLFSFRFDEHWNATFKEELSFAKDTYYFEGSKQWFPRPILFGEDGYLYAAFDEKGGTQRINPQNPKGDHTRILDHAPMHYILGEDGNFYYTENMTPHMDTLFKLTLN